jgi:hypothetical protein
VQNMNLLHDNYHSSRALCMLPVKCLQVPHVKLNIILMCVIPLMVPILRSAEDLRNFMKSSVWKCINFCSTLYGWRYIFYIIAI